MGTCLKISAALLMGAVGACGSGKSVYIRPQLPVLPSSIKAPCPPLPLLSDGLISTLIMADVDAAYMYAECQARHAGVVKIYEAAREKMGR